MAIPPSTVKAVRMQLFNTLKAAIGTQNALVCLDGPSVNEPDDIVSIGAVHRQAVPAQLVGGGGAGWIDEHYTIEVAVEVYKGGDFAQVCFERCEDLIYQVESAVRTDPTMGGLVIQATPHQSTSTGALPAEDHMGRLCSGVVHVMFHARL
jgi:hypothetical protein